MSDEPANGAPRVEYHEPGRGYASVVYFAVLIAAGFVFDLFLGGGVAHLPGWIGAFVIVIGLDLVVIHAARSAKSLTVTDSEIRIGDEAVERDRVVAADERLDPTHPVLGWETGPPRGLRGVTLLLDDDREVVVPTRRPALLLAALAVGTTTPPDERIEIRPADDDDMALLDEIDERADTLFRISGFDLPDLPFDEDELARAAAIFVAGRPAVGFAQLSVVDATAHLVEVAVIPGSMRKGLGRRLLDAACDWARAEGYDAITLTTYAEVAWNGPMYARHGWVELTDPTPGLVALRARETELGLDGVGRRIVMRREL